MKRTTPVLILALTLPQLCRAQAYKDEKLIYLDAYGQKTKERKAVVLEQQIKLEDTLYEINFYQIDGPMFKSFHASDPDGGMLTGEFRSYDAGGNLDTTGSFQEGTRNGEWQVYSKNRYAAKLLYDHGKLLWTKDTVQLKQESDSLSNNRKKDSVTVDSKTFTKVEIESEFPGGVKAWTNYLQKNMRYPDDAVKKRIQGVVIISFVVDKQGNVAANRVFIDRSVSYSLDQEALWIIFSSPRWTPAVQNGRAVNSYKKQPIVFRFQ